MNFCCIFAGLYVSAAKVCSSHFSDRSVSIEIGFNYSKVEHFWLLFKLTSNLETSANFGVLNKLTVSILTSRGHGII